MNIKEILLTNNVLNSFNELINIKDEINHIDEDSLFYLEKLSELSSSDNIHGFLKTLNEYGQMINRDFAGDLTEIILDIKDGQRLLDTLKQLAQSIGYKFTW